MSPELIIQKLKNLPQGKFLNESNLAHYASILSLHDDKKADWLIGRLAGIGGSETGILVSGLRNEADVFGASPSDLIAEKLLIAKPVQENNAMLMGIYMEAFVRERFYATYGAVRNEVAYAALCVAKHPSHEWMRYSPDDIVVMDGKNYLVDYKTPAEASSMSKIPMRYKAQLHQGFELCRVSDIKIEGLLLIQLPLDNRTLYVTEVDIDESIVRDIKTAGSEAWHDYILQGALPTRSAKDYLFEKFTEADTKVQQKILTLSDKHAKLKAAVGVFMDESKEIEVEILALAEQSKVFGTEKLPTTTLNITASFDAQKAFEFLSMPDNAYDDVLDKDALLEWAKANCGELSNFNSGTKVFNAERLQGMLIQKGADINNFNSLSVGLRTNSKGVAPFKDRVRQDVDNFLGLNQVEDNNFLGVAEPPKSVVEAGQFQQM